MTRTVHCVRQEPPVCAGNSVPDDVPDVMSYLRPASFITVIFAIPGVRTGSGRAGVPRFHRFTADDDWLPRTGSDVIGLALVGKARSTCLPECGQPDVVSSVLLVYMKNNPLSISATTTERWSPALRTASSSSYPFGSTAVLFFKRQERARPGIWTPARLECGYPGRCRPGVSPHAPVIKLALAEVLCPLSSEHRTLTLIVRLMEISSGGSQRAHGAEGGRRLRRAWEAAALLAQVFGEQR
ncbi:hypothetical protein VTO73DRAFT_11280 [Trametes versicolor]